MVVRLRRKGVVVIPKALREEVGVEEGDELIAEVVNGSIVLRPLRPRVVDVDAEAVHRIVREEKREWDERLDALTEEAGA
ncbi:MAG: AbrB family transcriptional regulator [Thermoprotei archaeon]|nr:MAG: AbrB family transcriptional regulator [Thermoprotei archaeon]